MYNSLKNNRGSLSVGESIALKLVSLLLALILWISIIGFKSEEVIKRVKFEPLLPPGLVLMSEIPSYIEYTFSGSRVLLKDVERRIQPIRPDLTKKDQDRALRLVLTSDMIGDLPAGVKVTSIAPQTVVLRLEELVEKTFEVKAVFQGLPEGHQVSRIKTSPSKVAVSGPKSIIDSLDSIRTQPIDLADVKSSKEINVALDVDESQGLHLTGEKNVQVLVFVKKMK
jgi:YbbR domain-containing protein